MSAFIEDFQVAILKALAHPTRLQIIMELQKGTKCVTDIHEILPASQANISQHLTILRNAEIVDFSQDGSQRCYYVCRPDLIAAMLSLLQEEQPGHKQQAPQCCRQSSE